MSKITDELYVREFLNNNQSTRYLIIAKVKGKTEKEIHVYTAFQQGGNDSRPFWLSNIQDVVDTLHDPIGIIDSSQDPEILIRSRILENSGTLRKFKHHINYSYDEFREKYPEYFI